MTTGRLPIVMCDADEGECGTWDTDYYEQTVSAVNGVPITREAPAPGWTRDKDGDFCPEHKEVATRGVV